MHVKFLAHGTGSGARASAYLLGAHDHTGAERAGVTVLRGDPALFAAVADSLPFQQRYSSAVISWAAEEAPTAAEIDEVLADFEALAFAGLEPEDYHMTVVQHDEPDGGAHDLVNDLGGLVARRPDVVRLVVHDHGAELAEELRHRGRRDQAALAVGVLR